MSLRHPDPSDPVVAALLARATFPEGAGALRCAVSGGADSTTLLALAVATGRPVVAVHVDHGLRPDSAAEAGHVAATAEAWGASFESHRVDLHDGPDLEARAREARHRAVGPNTLWGHTADDQAETVLLRLVRGTGPVGLAAMRSDRHPLLAVRRHEARSLCRHLGVEPLEDPANLDPRFDRVRIRTEVLPLLDDVARRDVVPLLAGLAARSAEVGDLLELLAAEVDPTSVAELRSVPRPVAVTAFRRWWRDRTRGLPPPDAAATDRVFAVVDGSSRACEVVRGWSLHRTAGRLRLDRTGRIGPEHPPRQVGRR